MVVLEIKVQHRRTYKDASMASAMKQREEQFIGRVNSKAGSDVRWLGTATSIPGNMISAKKGAAKEHISKVGKANTSVNLIGSRI
jgi:hypothetical protein